MNAMEWGALWALLNERFGTTKSVELGAFYFQELAAQLDSQAIKAGVRKVLVSARFFPSPDEIMQAAGMSPEAAALSEWGLCQSLMEGSRTAYERMSETGRKMVRLLGGAAALRNSSIDSVPFIRKEWLKHYSDAQEIDAHERKMLAPMTAEGRKLLSAALSGEPMPDVDAA